MENKIKLTNDEKLALLTAVSKRIEPELKEIKSDAKSELNEIMSETGADRKPIMIGDEKVGDISLTYHKPKPVIIDMHDAIVYLRELGLTHEVPNENWEEHFSRAGDSVIHTESGELCDFLGWQGRTPNYAKVTGCDADDVKNVLSSKLGKNTGIIGLLDE